MLKEESIIIEKNMDESNVFGYVKQVFDQLRKKDDGVYFDIESKQRFTKQGKIIFLGDISRDKYEAFLQVLEDDAFEEDIELDLENKRFKYLKDSIQMIQGNDKILKERYSIIVDQNLTNNRDLEENVVYRFGRLANFRDTDTLRSMSAETNHVWRNGSLLFEFYDYNDRNLKDFPTVQTKITNVQNTEVFNSDLAYFATSTKKSKEYIKHIEEVHQKIEDSKILNLLDKFLFPDETKQWFGEVTTYGNIKLRKETVKEFPKKVHYDENSKQFSVHEKKAHVATSDIIFWSEEESKAKAQEFCKTLTDEQKNALIFYLLGYATLGKTSEDDDYHINQNPLFTPRIAAKNDKRLLNYTIYEGFLFNVMEQRAILHDELRGRQVSSIPLYHKNREEFIRVAKSTIDKNKFVPNNYDIRDENFRFLTFAGVGEGFEKEEQDKDTWFIFESTRAMYFFWEKLSILLENILDCIIEPKKGYSKIYDAYKTKYLKDNLEELLISNVEMESVYNAQRGSRFQRFSEKDRLQIFMDRVETTFSLLVNKNIMEDEGFIDLLAFSVQKRVGKEALNVMQELSQKFTEYSKENSGLNSLYGFNLPRIQFEWQFTFFEQVGDNFKQIHFVDKIFLGSDDFDETDDPFNDLLETFQTVANKELRVDKMFISQKIDITKEYLKNVLNEKNINGIFELKKGEMLKETFSQERKVFVACVALEEKS